MVSFGLLSGFLLVGLILRCKVRLIEKVYLPASVVGGILGLVALQFIGKNNVALNNDITAGWSELPSILINVVFAALFMGKKIPRFKLVWKSCSRQLGYGQIVAWGQYAVGCVLVLFFLGPVLSLPDVYAGVMPVGFEGGHGTAAGMKPVFESLGFPQIKDMALAAATFGIISAIVMGMILINWAKRKGLVQTYNEEVIRDKEVVGKITISSEIIGTLSLQIVFLGLAILFGWSCKKIFYQISLILPGNWSVLVNSFPMFPLCMLGGVFLQCLCDKFGFSRFLCRGLMLQIQNLALDFLVIAAISTISLDIVADNFLALIILVFGGIIWNYLCLRIIAPRVFSDAWFERAIAELGQSMGVTATGLLLLRTVDPDCQTDAASAFASKQLLHEPFMGGGLWTGIAIPLLVLWGGWSVLGIVTGVIFFWLLFLYRTR